MAEQADQRLRQDRREQRGSNAERRQPVQHGAAWLRARVHRPQRVERERHRNQSVDPAREHRVRHGSAADQQPTQTTFPRVARERPGAQRRKRQTGGIRHDHHARLPQLATHRDQRPGQQRQNCVIGP